MSARVCYTPDGQNRNKLANENATDGWFYAPCNNAAAESMCCAIGPGRDGSQDVCRDDGLCSNIILCDNCVWRESCTDPSWQDPACIKLFVNGTGINATMGTTHDKSGDVINDVEVYECSDGSFCFGETNVECCRKNQGVYIYNGEQVAFNPNTTAVTTSTSSVSSTTTTSATGSSSPTSSSSAAPISTTTPSKGLSTGAQAGIGVGAGLGGLFLIALVFWCFRRQAKKSREGHHQRSELPYETSRPEMGPTSPAQPSYEMPTSGGYRSPTAHTGLMEMDGSTSYSGSQEGTLKKDTPIERYS